MNWETTLVVCLLFLLLFPALARAVMPPHISDTEPANGGVLTTDTVVLHGWSLGFTDPAADIKVTDTVTQTLVPFTATKDCAWEGEGEMPGARQERCTFEVKLEGLVEGREYELHYLDEVLRFTYQP